MAFTKMQSMELSDDDKLDMTTPIADVMTTPDYPWGLRIAFTQSEMDKLGIDEMPDIGDVIDLRCFARVTAVSANKDQSGKCCRIEMQIEDIATLEDESTED